MTVDIPVAHVPILVTASSSSAHLSLHAFAKNPDFIVMSTVVLVLMRIVANIVA